MGNESSTQASTRAVPGQLSEDEALLHRCAQVGDINRLRGMIRRKVARLDCADPNGNTALHKAAWHGHLAICRLLVRDGARARLVNSKNMTAHSLAVQQSRTECVAFLEDIMALPDPSVVRAKFRKKVRTSNCAKVFGPRESIRGKHLLIPGVPELQEGEGNALVKKSPAGYSDAAHWDLEREDKAFGPSAPAAKPMIQLKLVHPLNANLAAEEPLTLSERQSMLREERFFNAWKAIVQYSKQTRLDQAAGPHLTVIPRAADHGALPGGWGCVTAASWAALTALWLQEAAYFQRHAARWVRVRATAGVGRGQGTRAALLYEALRIVPAARRRGASPERIAGAEEEKLAAIWPPAVAGAAEGEELAPYRRAQSAAAASGPSEPPALPCPGVHGAVLYDEVAMRQLLLPADGGACGGGGKRGGSRRGAAAEGGEAPAVRTGRLLDERRMRELLAASDAATGGATGGPLERQAVPEETEQAGATAGLGGGGARSGLDGRMSEGVWGPGRVCSSVESAPGPLKVASELEDDEPSAPSRNYQPLPQLYGLPGLSVERLASDDEILL